jgi:transposase
VKAQRESWFEQFADVTLDRLVFVDEFGASTQMQRTHGRAPRGQRVVSKVPHGHWKSISTIAAMTTRGMTACASFDGATDAELFALFAREALAPTLRPGQIVVLDNLAAHKTPLVKRLIEETGATLLPLPPYSPDYNPIEQAISKVKGILRSLARREVKGLFAAIREALGSITADDAIAFMRHSGYAIR